jgi:hypothetical protein
LGAIFSAVPFVGPFIGTLLASLALVQFSTAWVHKVIAVPSNKSFRGRLLPFKRVFEATCFPILISWVAMTINQWTPLLLGWALHIKVWNMDKDNSPPEYHSSDVWKFVIIMIVALLVNVAIVLPAHVLLVRVRTSIHNRISEARIKLTVVLQRPHFCRARRTPSFPSIALSRASSSPLWLAERVTVSYIIDSRMLRNLLTLKT